MKKLFVKLSTLAMASVLTIPMFTACGEGGQQASGGSGNANATKTLVVHTYEAGYGTGWLQKAADNFCAKYPEYKVEFYSDAGMFDKLQQEIDAGNSSADIAVISDKDYRKLASNGKLVGLNDLMEETVPDSTMKVKEIIPEAHLTYRSVAGTQYGVPWQDNYANGIVYNKKIFEQYDLTIPTTMDEYFELCEDILALPCNTNSSTADDLAPLVYTGINDAYAMNFTNQWMVEYYGYDYMQEVFLKYETYKIYEETEAGRQKAYDTLYKMLKTTGYYLSGSETMTHTVAQQKFISAKPKAAMYICGSWFPVEEASKLETLGANFEYGFFGLPHVNADKKSVRTVSYTGKTYTKKDSSTVRYSLGSNTIAIPTTSHDPEGAKLFIKELYSGASLTAFVQENCGISRPLTITPDISAMDVSTNKGMFTKQVYDYYKGTATKPTKTIYDISMAKMANILSPCMFGGNGEHVVQNTISKTGYNVAKAAERETAKVKKDYWDSDANNWKATYLN